MNTNQPHAKIQKQDYLIGKEKLKQSRLQSQAKNYFLSTNDNFSSINMGSVDNGFADARFADARWTDSRFADARFADARFA